MGVMGAGDIAIIIFVIVALIVAGLYFLNRWAAKKMDEQQKIVERTKQHATIYVIDKKKVKAAESSLPKMVTEKLPFVYKFIKTPLVKAKVGPQIVTLMCEKKVFDALPLKKNVKVELSGIYIVSMQGLKTEKEMKQIAKNKKLAAKGEAPAKPWDKALAAVKGFGKKR